MGTEESLNAKLGDGRQTRYMSAGSKTLQNTESTRNPLCVDNMLCAPRSFEENTEAVNDWQSGSAKDSKTSSVDRENESRHRRQRGCRGGRQRGGTYKGKGPDTLAGRQTAAYDAFRGTTGRGWIDSTDENESHGWSDHTRENESRGSID